jgi:hypothetical protein
MFRALLVATLIVASAGLPAIAAPEQSPGVAQKRGARHRSTTSSMRGRHHYQVTVRSTNGRGRGRVVSTHSSMNSARRAQQRLQMQGMRATIRRV